MTTPLCERRFTPDCYLPEPRNEVISWPNRIMIQKPGSW